MNLAVFLADVADPRFGGSGAQQRRVQQVQNTLGRVAVAVHQLGEQIVAVVLGAYGRHAAIQVHPLLAGGHIGLGDVGGDGKICRTLHCLVYPLAPLFQNGLFQKLQIHVVAH